ncbi:unnamed protein product [Phytomonas sp. EM1]|nr:unnamed protein product [Phytomonas sp. EM1]|eukprot:CCW62738.1 unnamed protein product [Phytomonas sp. isolate EM1]
MSSSNHLPSRRKEIDVMKLLKASQKVYLSKNISEFWVEFVGPEGTPYEDGTWILHVLLPPEYPFKSPSIGFANRIWHPNIDETSGSVCLDVINQTWTPMYELKNIFDVFLPQLLRYPNPEDPLNPSAAAQLQRDPTGYVSHLQEHVAAHATREKALASIPTPYGPPSPHETGGGTFSSTEGFNVNGHPPAQTPPEGAVDGMGNGTRGELDDIRVGQLYPREEEEYIPEEIEL